MTTAESLVAKAASLVPGLRERADEADRNGVLHDETIQEFVSMDLIRTMVPSRFGGLEMDWSVGSRVLETVAMGCSSAAWVLNAYLCTTWVVATFSEEAQKEVFGTKGYAIGPCPMNPRLGRARRVKGGYQVSLKAPFGSGVQHSDWAVLCASVEGSEANSPKGAEALVLLIPREQFTFDLQTWSVLGMRGTGSATIHVNDVFVPDHRAMDLAKLGDGTAPGLALNRAAMYRVPYISGFILMSGGVLVGMARHGLEEFEKLVKTRVYAMTGQPQSNAVGAQMRVSEAAAYTAAAAALFQVDMAQMMSGVEHSTLSLDDRARFRLDTAYGALLCRQAIDCIKDGAGANALRDGSPIQRTYRDLHMISANFGYQMDYMKELFGRARMGMAIDPNEV